MKQVKCVITDDEPTACEGLQRYVEKVDFLSLMGVCEDTMQLNTLLQTEQPDLLFLDIEKIGPAFENHVAFPDRVNTEFVEVIDEHTVKMRVWERGSGETLACGTGACAVAVASILNNLTDTRVTVKLLGGDLQIEWDREKNHVFMTGPAKVVFDGVIDITEIKE